MNANSIANLAPLVLIAVVYVLVVLFVEKRRRDYYRNTIKKNNNDDLNRLLEQATRNPNGVYGPQRVQGPQHHAAILWTMPDGSRMGMDEFLAAYVAIVDRDRGKTYYVPREPFNPEAMHEIPARVVMTIEGEVVNI